MHLMFFCLFSSKMAFPPKNCATSPFQKILTFREILPQKKKKLFAK